MIRGFHLPESDLLCLRCCVETRCDRALAVTRKAAVRALKFFTGLTFRVGRMGISEGHGEGARRANASP